MRAVLHHALRFEDTSKTKENNIARMAKKNGTGYYLCAQRRISPSTGADSEVYSGGPSR